MKTISNKAGLLLTFLLILSLLMLTFAGCASYENFKDAFLEKGNVSEETVRIAVYQPLSGPDEKHGELERAGIEIAHKMFPTALGKKVELLYFDNKSDIYVAEAIAQEMVDKRVALVLGSYGSVNSLMAVEKLEAASIPAIAITNTNPLVTSFNPFYFRVSYTDAFQGVALAKYATEGMGVTGAAVLRPMQDDFAAAVSKSFSDKMVQLTGDPSAVPLTEEYIGGQKDFRESLEKIQASGVPVVFLPAKGNVAAAIINQAREMGMKVTFLGTDLWETEAMLELNLERTGIRVIYSTLFDANRAINPLSESFLRAYQAEYGKDKEPESAVALAFDAYLIGIDALNRAGTALKGDAVREALQMTMQFKGASGTISFDANGDPIKSVAIKGIFNHKAESIYTVEPTWVVQTVQE